MSVIEVDGLVKTYGDRNVVDGVSFAVEQGEIFGIIGPNGAGKTVTVESVEGLRRPRQNVFHPPPEVTWAQQSDRIFHRSANASPARWGMVTTMWSTPPPLARWRLTAQAISKARFTRTL